VKPPRVNYSAQLSSPKPWFIVACVALVVALGMAAFTARFVGRSAVAAGTVTGLREVSGQDDGKTYYAPDYSFTAQDGRAHSGYSSSGSNPPAFTVGEAIRVRYDKADPSRNEIDTFWSLWGLSTGTALFGGFFAVLGFAMRAAMRRKSQTPAIATK
jgi:Protein of unknown function (DUF3592)